MIYRRFRAFSQVWCRVLSRGASSSTRWADKSCCSTDCCSAPSRSFLPDSSSAIGCTWCSRCSTEWREWPCGVTVAYVCDFSRGRRYRLGLNHCGDETLNSIKATRFACASFPNTYSIKNLRKSYTRSCVFPVAVLKSNHNHYRVGVQKEWATLTF